jgi:hypothetical protein
LTFFLKQYSVETTKNIFWDIHRSCLLYAIEYKK